MNNALKRLVGSAVLVLALSSPPAWPTGFPTVDIAAIMQGVLQYMQEIEQYTTLLSQEALEESQLLQAIIQYEQMLREYEHYLRMVQGLRDFFSEAEWRDILNTIELSNNNPYDPDFDMTIYTSTGVVNMDREIERMYKRSRQMAAMTADLNFLGSPPGMQGDAQRLFERSRLVTLQANTVVENQQQLEEQIAANEALQGMLDAVVSQPESQLATLQLMATQNQSVLNNLQLIASIQNQNLNFSNQLSTELFSNVAANADAKIRYLRSVVESPPAAGGSFNSF